MELHLIPGHFSAAAKKVLHRLPEGTSGRFRIAETTGCGKPEIDLAILSEPERGEARSVSGMARVMGSRALPVEVETFGGHPQGRVLLRVAIRPDDQPGVTPKDLEMGLLGLACAALSGEEHGAVLIGGGLGPVGVAVPRGTVAEQIEGLLELHGECVQVMVMTAATWKTLGHAPGFEEAPLGDLVELRRG